MEYIFAVVDEDVALVGEEVLLDVLNATSASPVVQEAAGLVAVLIMICLLVCLPRLVLGALPLCQRVVQAVVDAHAYSMRFMRATVGFASQFIVDIFETVGFAPSWLPQLSTLKRGDYTQWTADEDDLERAKAAFGANAAALEPVMETYALSMTKLQARGLPNTDGVGFADPYVVVKHGSVELMRTEDLRNAVNGSTDVVLWPREYTGRASWWQSRTPTITLTVYDKESATGSDAGSQVMGRGTFEVELVDGTHQPMNFRLSEVPTGAIASVSLVLHVTRESNTLAPAPAASAPPKQPGSKGRVTISAPVSVPAPAKTAKVAAAAPATSKPTAPAAAKAPAPIPAPAVARAPAPAMCVEAHDQPLPAPDEVEEDEDELVARELRGVVESLEAEEQAAANATKPGSASASAPAPAPAPPPAVASSATGQTGASIPTLAEGEPLEQPRQQKQQVEDELEPPPTHRSQQPPLSSRSSRPPLSSRSSRTPRHTPRHTPRTPRHTPRTTRSPRQARPGSANQPWNPLDSAKPMVPNNQWNPVLRTEEMPKANWRDTNHAHRMQINFAVDLRGVTGDPIADAAAVPPPAEIAFILTMYGVELEMPPADSVKVHRAVAVKTEAMRLPQGPDRLDYARRVTVAGPTYDPFMLFGCSHARTSDVVGFDEKGGIFDGVEICVHVPQELNPCLAYSAYSSFVFSRLGSVDRNGTHFSAHVALMISLATRPLDSPATRDLASPDAEAMMMSDGDYSRAIIVPSLAVEDIDAKDEAAEKRATPARKVPPVVPILPAIAAQAELPSLAKSIAQIRMDSARRRQEERWTQLRLDTARWRASEDQKQQLGLMSARTADVSSGCSTSRSALTARGTSASRSARGASPLAATGPMPPSSARTARPSSARPPLRGLSVML